MILDLQTNPIYKTDEGDEISKEKIKKVYELLTPYFWKVHVQIIKDQSRKDFGYVIDLVVEKIAKFIDKFKGEKEDGTKVKFENWLSVVIKRSGLDTGKKSDRKTGEAEKEVEKDNKEYPIAPSAPAAPPGFKLDRRQTKALLNRFIDELPEKIKKLKPEEIEELNKKLNKKEKFNSITAERSGNFLTAVYDFYKTAPGPGGKSNNQWREEAGRKIATAFHSSDHNRDWQAEAMEELGYTDADLRNPKRAVEIEARAEENMLDAFEGRSPASLVDQKAFVDFYLIKRKRFKQIADREATLGTYLDMEVPLEKSKEISELLNSNIEKLEKDKKNINFEKLKDVYLAGYKPNDLLDFETIEELEDYEQEKKYLKDKPSKEEKAEASPTYRSMHVINPTSLARRLKELMPLAKLALMKFEKKDPETVQDIRQRRSVKEAIKEAIMEVLNETEVDNAREENLQETIAEALKDFLKKK
jgi:DNA-directed RNA polymerase specialized sigma24 family protein